MSKLFKLKKWLTLNEVVNHLSNVLGESVTLSDIYKLALDGYLKLSIEFINGAKVKKVKIIKKEDIIYEKILPVGIPLISTGSYFSIPKNVVCPISNNHWIQAIDHKVISIKGTWDLAMIGAERADIENRYHKEISGHSVEIPLISGFYVMRDDIYYQLQILEKNIANTDDDLVPMEINLGGGLSTIKMKPRRLPVAYQANSLDNYTNILVIKTSEITRFIQSLEDSPKEKKQLHGKERKTLMLLLVSILKKANVDINEKGVAGKIRKITEFNGTPVSEQTIRDLLPQLQDIAEEKQSN